MTTFDKLTIEEMYQVCVEYFAARDRFAPKHERQKLLDLWSSRIGGLPYDYQPLARVAWKYCKAIELKEEADTELENMKLPDDDIKRQWEELFKERLER